MARYAISDIHGCLRTFKKSLREVEFSKEDQLYLLGDYIDRGLDSKGVVDYIIELQKDHNLVALKGNHEDFLLQAMTDRGTFRSWLYNGGNNTLQSYGYPLDNSGWANYIPKEHIEWYESLPSICVLDDYVLVHGGLNFRSDDPINKTFEDEMLWNRIYREPGNARSVALGGRVLVTGHTPTDKETMFEMANGEDMITIDRGCVFKHSEYGHLAVFNLDTKQFRFVKNIDNIERD